MRTHIILAHPEAKSFNGKLASISETVLGANGGKTTLSDLYAMDFDPREGPQHFQSRQDAEFFHAQTEQRHSTDSKSLSPAVEAEIKNLEECELLVVHFPIWWFGAPAMLKGWMDRVFVYGRMYKSQIRYDQGVCAGKKMIACVTTGASEDSCAYNGREGDTQLHLWPLLFPFRYLGFTVLEPEVFHGVGGVAFIENNEDGLSAIDSYSDQWSSTLNNLSIRPSIKYNSDDDFDETKRLRSGAPVYSPFVRHKADVWG